MLQKTNYLYSLLLIALCVVGCDTPYTGALGPQAFNGWIESEENGLVCLWNGFDRICIRTIPGRDGIDGIDGRDGIDGKDGIDGIDGESIVGPRGRRGRAGAVVYLVLEKIVVETVFVEVPVIQKEFVLAVSKTETTYTTPMGEVYVPENAAIVVPADVVVTPMTVDPTPIAPPVVTVPTVIAPPNPDPAPDPAPKEDDEIWHVAYSVETYVINGVETSTVYAYAYPRCFNNPYLSPPLPYCESHIEEDEFLDETSELKNEIQGTKEFVNAQLDMVLGDNKASLGHVGGIQGIVN